LGLLTLLLRAGPARGGKWLENPFCWETTRAREVMQHDVVDAARTNDSSGESI
jgi:hypothetical protein